MPTPTCSTCRWWKNQSINPDFKRIGDCTYGPPCIVVIPILLKGHRIANEISAGLPKTEGNFGCGRHEPVEEPANG